MMRGGWYYSLISLPCSFYLIMTWASYTTNLPEKTFFSLNLFEKCGSIMILACLINQSALQPCHRTFQLRYPGIAVEQMVNSSHIEPRSGGSPGIPLVTPKPPPASYRMPGLFHPWSYGISVQHYGFLNKLAHVCVFWTIFLHLLTKCNHSYI